MVQIDHSLRIIFASGKLRRIQRESTYSGYTSGAGGVIVVIDTGGFGQRFVPVAIPNGDAIYTRDGVAHVVLGGTDPVIRMKVSASGLPHKVCNKFLSPATIVHAPTPISDPINQKYDTPKPTGNITETSAQLRHGVLMVQGSDSNALDSNALPSLGPRPPVSDGIVPDAEADQRAAGMMKNLHSEAFGSARLTTARIPPMGLLLIRIDESIFRFNLPPPSEVKGAAAEENPPRNPSAGSRAGSQQVELYDGRPVMWTSGIRFHTSITFFCFKKVTSASGAGRLWIDATKSPSHTPPPFLQ